LLFLMACISSSYVVLNVLPFSSVYFSGQGILFGRCRFSCIYLYISGVLVCSVLCFMCKMLFLFVSEKICNLYSFPLYVNVAHFVFIVNQCVHFSFEG
jgi:hypothetical protein